MEQDPLFLYYNAPRSIYGWGHPTAERTDLLFVYQDRWGWGLQAQTDWEILPGIRLDGGEEEVDPTEPDPWSTPDG